MVGEMELLKIIPLALEGQPFLYIAGNAVEICRYSTKRIYLMAHIWQSRHYLHAS